ncbi:unnamed protein product [Parnassius apollo]|uniref:(apollo) hypothetical protein n=1 Tax=Parnassius apollo TaxID=110799 RepID=A0A8S3WJ41_PARAO|nr:unnamed protein product [Parnassius apollo]
MADARKHVGTGTSDISERDFVLYLISLYRDSPVLWNAKRKDYVDKSKRSVALQNIIRSLRIYKPTYSEEELKKKINTLRTNFNKERNKINKARRSGISPDDVQQPTLWYYNEMLFLIDQTSVIIKTECSEQSPLQQKKTLQKKRRNTLTDDLVNTASKYSKRSDNESDIIAKSWAIKLSRLAHDQKRYAEKIVNDVLFEGAMGTLTRNGVRFLPASSTSCSFDNSGEFCSSPSPSSCHATNTSPKPDQKLETLSDIS